MVQLYVSFAIRTTALSKEMLCQSSTQPFQRASDINVPLNKDLEVKESITPTKDLDIYVNGTKWNETTLTTDTFTLKNNETEINFPQMYAFDNDGDTIYLQYELKKVGQQTFLTTNVPKDWVNNAIFPITIEPSWFVNESVGAIEGTNMTFIHKGTIGYGSDTNLTSQYYSAVIIFEMPTAVNTTNSTLNYVGNYPILSYQSNYTPPVSEARLVFIEDMQNPINEEFYYIGFFILIIVGLGVAIKTLAL